MGDTVHLLGKSASSIGILSRPAGEARDVAVIFLNSGLLHRTGPFRLYVEIARRLADAGFACLRIDQAGKGDSERRKGLNFAESIRKDFEEASRFLANNLGSTRFILVGLCSGADDALLLTNDFPEVVGTALMEPYAGRTWRYYVRHYGPRLVRLDLWGLWAGRFAKGMAKRLTGRRGAESEASAPMWLPREFPGHAEMRRRFTAPMERGAKLLCVFTDGARRYYNYRGQLAEQLGVRPGKAPLTEIYMPWAKHTYPLVGHRDEVVDHVCAWVEKEFQAKADAPFEASLPPKREAR
jgi:pimeloyl-ACP methyl ester carboxylesterase